MNTGIQQDVGVFVQPVVSCKRSFMSIHWTGPFSDMLMSTPTRILLAVERT